MGTRFESLGISSSEVSGVVASALIQDLRINNFTFTNFPEIIITWDNENFFVKLQAHGASSSPETITHSYAKSLVIAFRKKEEIDQEFFEKVQNLVAMLEMRIK